MMMSNESRKDLAIHVAMKSVVIYIHVTKIHHAYLQEEMNVPKKLFIGRLPEGTLEKELEDYFVQFGELTDVYIPRPNRNFGFVTYSSSDVAQSVVNQNHQFRDSLLNVSFAEPKATNPMKMMGGGHHGGHNVHVWNSQWGGGRQGGGNPHGGSHYGMMKMMSPSMPGMGSNNKTWSRGQNMGSTSRK